METTEIFIIDNCLLRSYVQYEIILSRRPQCYKRKLRGNLNKDSNNIFCFYSMSAIEPVTKKWSYGIITKEYLFIEKNIRTVLEYYLP